MSVKGFMDQLRLSRDARQHNMLYIVKQGRAFVHIMIAPFL